MDGVKGGPCWSSRCTCDGKWMESSRVGRPGASVKLKISVTVCGMRMCLRCECWMMCVCGAKRQTYPKWKSPVVACTTKPGVRCSTAYYCFSASDREQSRQADNRQRRRDRLTDRETNGQTDRRQTDRPTGRQAGEKCGTFSMDNTSTNGIRNVVLTPNKLE
jgi:hypothetical protein